jgi:anti-anti-sigma factor
MSTTLLSPMDTAIFPAGEQTEQSELAELVWGHDQPLLARLTPLVRRQSVTLDLGTVQRIDAAGIAALISLYASAHEAGQRFTVSNPTARVAQILALVGLDRILLSQNVVQKSHCDPVYVRPAA